MSKVTFDGPNKLIIVDSGITSLDAKIDLYSDWKEWVLVSDNSKYLPAFTAIGGDPIGGGLYTGITFIQINGWLIRPDEVDHTLTINGNLFGDAGAPIITPTLGDYTVLVQLRNSTQAQGISTSGGTLTAADVWSYSQRTLTALGDSNIADAIRAELLTELTHLMTLQNGLTTPQATMLLEVYRLYGLDPTKPLVVTNTSRSAGAEVQQQIVTDTNSTTVTRI